MHCYFLQHCTVKRNTVKNYKINWSGFRVLANLLPVFHGKNVECFSYSVVQCVYVQNLTLKGSFHNHLLIR